MKPIEKNNICDEVFNSVVQDIIVGKLKTGDKIASENELKNMLGVSRNTVRSALSRLNALGILEVRQGEGYFIRNLNIGVYLNALMPVLLRSSSDLETITEFRIGLESEASALAAERATEDDFHEMEYHLRYTEENYYDDDKFALGDMNFHLAIAKASKNELCVSATEMIKTLYTVWLSGFVRNHGREKSRKFHRQIYEAIMNRESDLARKMMYEHLTDVLHKLKLESDSVWKASIAVDKTKSGNTVG